MSSSSTAFSTQPIAGDNISLTNTIVSRGRGIGNGDDDVTLGDSESEGPHIRYMRFYNFRPAASFAYVPGALEADWTRNLGDAQEGAEGTFFVNSLIYMISRIKLIIKRLGRTNFLSL